MAIAKGVSKRVVIAEEGTNGTSYGTAATTNANTELRRVVSTLSMNRDAFQSREILTSQQMRDARLGVKRPGGAIVSEVSPGANAWAWRAIARRAFTAGATAAGTIAASTVNSSSGKFIYNGSNPITLGIKVGDIVKGSGFTSASNTNALLRVSSVNTSEVYGAYLSSIPLVGEGSAASRAAIAVGKKTWVPSTGHSSVSMFVEHWFSDVSIGERFTGLKVAQIDLNVPPTDMATIQVSLMGQDMSTAAATYFSTAVTPASTNSVLAGVNGALAIDGVGQAGITSLRMTMTANLSSDPVVGTNIIREQVDGRVVIQGSLTALFEDATMRDKFLSETTVQLHLVLVDSSTPVPNFVSLFLPKVKLTSNQKDDGEKAIIQSFDFMALEETSSTPNTELTTFVVQDSLA